MCKIRRKIVFFMMSNFKVLSLADDRATLRNDERKKNKNKNAKKRFVIIKQTKKQEKIILF